jgi:glycine/D-amino acid oxidase-like deaminating enzyme
LVLGLNGYAPRLGFFSDRVLPLCSYVIATEPLTAAQWEAIGWRHRRGIADLRVLFDYQRPTAHGRIVVGGSDAPYFAGDALSAGNYKPAIDAVTRSFFTTFPQLEGLRIAHAWGGTMGFTLDFTPAVGVMGEHKNIFYGVAYNGEGVAFAQTAGRIIAELMAGEESELTRLCVVNHNMPYLGPAALRIVFERLYKWYLVRAGERTVR